MFDLFTFILSDYRCPHCGSSLRFRRVKSIRIPLTRWKDDVTTSSYEVCPACAGKIKSDWHPAIIDDWLWMKRLAPGILIWIVALFMDFHPVAMMLGTVVLLAGFVAVLYYTVAERWQRPYYVLFDPLSEEVQPAPGPD